MLRNIGLLLIVGLLAAPAARAADDTYTIKFKRGAKDDVLSSSKQDTDLSKFKLEGPDGKILQEKDEKKLSTVEYRETILEKPDKDKRATRIRRQYTKAVVKTGDDEKALPYQGKTVLIDRKAGTYHFTLEGGKELTGDDAKLLEKEFNNKDDADSNEVERMLLPRKPVRINETWKVDPVDLVKSFEKGTKGAFTIDAAKTTATGKLLRAYQKNGKQFGAIEFRITLPVTGSIPAGDAKAEIRPGAKMIVRINVDGCIDGSATDAVADMAMDMDLTAVLKGPDGQDYTMVITAKNTMKSVEKDLTRK